MTAKWINKIAVITGTSSGIGYAIFKEFATSGITTIGLDISTENTEKLIDELSHNFKVNCYVYKCDVSNEDSVNEVFDAIERKFHVIHILVNNAGKGRKADILDNDAQSWSNMNNVIDTNIRGLLMCTRKSFQLMTKSDDYGLIININSIAGHLIPWVSFSLNVYCATKHAVTALTENIRQELYRAGNTKIRIASVSPGLVDSNFVGSSGYFDDNNALKDVPLLNPTEVAKCVMFILSTPYDVSVSDIIIRSTGEQF